MYLTGANNLVPCYCYCLVLLPGANSVDMEYMRNTTLKLYDTGEAETLLPVYATILAFSKEEVGRPRGGGSRGGPQSWTWTLSRCPG